MPYHVLEARLCLGIESKAPQGKKKTQTIKAAHWSVCALPGNEEITLGRSWCTRHSLPVALWMPLKGSEVAVGRSGCCCARPPVSGMTVGGGVDRTQQIWRPAVFLHCLPLSPGVWQRWKTIKKSKESNVRVCKEKVQVHNIGQFNKDLAISPQWLVTFLPLLGCFSWQNHLCMMTVVSRKE